MSKSKADINKNFENLKAQMMKKRELAENVKSSEEVINKSSINTKVDDLSIYTHRNSAINKSVEDTNAINNDSKENKNVDIDVYKNEDKKASTLVNDNSLFESKESNENNNSEDTIELYIHEDTDTSSSPSTEYIAKRTGVVSDININKIVIKKVEKQEAPKRITYYLRPDTIKKIDKFSRLSGMGKSEFVQKILDEVLNNLEIER